MESLKLELDKIIENSKEKIALLIKNIDDNQIMYNCNNNIKTISASLIKIPIMLSVFEKIKNNEISFDTKIYVKNDNILDDTEEFKNEEDFYTIEELVNWMITISDNTSTNILIDYLSFEYINNYIFNKLQLSNTILERKMLDYNKIREGYNNYTNQNDMLKIFEMIYKNKILNKELCNKAIKILSEQKINNQIPRYFNKKIWFAHKTGALDYLNHDVGIININNKIYYVGISIYDSDKKESNRQLSGLIGKKIFEYLEKDKIKVME